MNNILCRVRRYILKYKRGVYRKVLLFSSKLLTMEDSDQCQYVIFAPDRFETRKVIFDAANGLNNPEEAFIKAVKFELMWLNNKRNYYASIAASQGNLQEIFLPAYYPHIYDLTSVEKHAKKVLIA